VLASEVLAGAWRLKIFETLGSTSDCCRDLAAAGEPEGLAVLARWQDEGRGRRGRTWTSARGNLFLSLLLRPRGPHLEVGLWPLLAAIAVVDAIAPLMPDPTELSLKWPNDVLLHGRKLAGILLDSAANSTGGLDWLVIGFGVNLAVAPAIPERSVAALAEVVPPPPPEQLATSLLVRVDHWRAVRQHEGFQPIREAWLERAQPIGTPLTLRVGEHQYNGDFAGLADDGSLLLRAGGRVQSFAAGELVPQEKG
jgi:BirA family transcriptional regulator, biotin operon repressor / biotin---[acetyl-CoA-carboxylase] ligase